MTATGQGIIESVHDAQESALKAVRKFLDTVDGVFPDLTQDGVRRKVIDAAFKMTEQMVSASTELAEKVVKVASEALATPRSVTGA